MTKALQPDDLISHYRIIRALGAGGMGEVYLARDSTLDRNVALKVLPQMGQDGERVRRFVLEAKSASSLNHPHIITVYEIGCEPVISGGTPRAEKVHYIAMELVDGDSLAGVIHEHKADLKSLLGYLAQAADGLAKTHASGIVHRDLKPGNIMVSKDGYAKVLDFGLAKLVEKEAAPDATIDVATKQALTVEGMIVGTIGYMAPEQILGRPVDHRADIFSFGCILYEGITRQRPFTANSQFEALQKIIHEHPIPIESVVTDAPVELRQLVARGDRRLAGGQVRGPRLAAERQMAAADPADLHGHGHRRREGAGSADHGPGVHAGWRSPVVLHGGQGEPAVRLVVRGTVARRRSEAQGARRGHRADVLAGRQDDRVRAGHRTRRRPR